MRVAIPVWLELLLVVVWVLWSYGISSQDSLPLWRQAHDSPCELWRTDRTKHFINVNSSSTADQRSKVVHWFRKKLTVSIELGSNAVAKVRGLGDVWLLLAS